MLEVKLYDLGYCKESEYTRVVCVSRYRGKYVFCYNKKRNGFEIPGGHIEENETWLDAATREMYEETGATKIQVTPNMISIQNPIGVDSLEKEYVRKLRRKKK